MSIIESLITEFGLPALFILILLEYACFPVSSEVVLPLAGLMGALHGMPFLFLVFASTVSGLLGTCITYGIGRFGGSPLLEKAMKRFPSFEKPILASYRTFGRRGRSAVFLSRLIPLCRTYIGFVAGAMKQPLSSYLFCSAFGILLWNTILTSLGYYFYQYRQTFFFYLNTYKKWIVLLGGITLFIILLFRFAANQKESEEIQE